MSYAANFNTAYLTDQTTATAVGLGAAVNGVRPLGNNLNVFVQQRMSVAAATCSVYVILHSELDGTAPIGIAAPGPQTATATAARDLAVSGDYWSQILVFAGSGAPYYEVRHAAPSSGNVDTYTWKA